MRRPGGSLIPGVPVCLDSTDTKWTLPCHRVPLGIDIAVRPNARPCRVAEVVLRSTQAVHEAKRVAPKINNPAKAPSLDSAA